MRPFLPQVHLLICFDQRVKPGVVLQALDILRTKQWQTEVVLVCDQSWRPFVNIDQNVIFVDPGSFREAHRSKNSVQYFDSILDQLDNFDIVEVTQLGDLEWGRWILGYYEDEDQIRCNQIEWDGAQLSSVEIINDIARELSIDPSLPQSEGMKSQVVYIDPYEESRLSKPFIEMIEKVNIEHWPSWLQILTHEKDGLFFQQMGFEEHIVEIHEIEKGFFNQSILVFSEASPFCQTSRSYNVAILTKEKAKSLFLPGDISISLSEDSHPVELFNILAYWKSRRLRELAFQWMNMGIEIQILESFLGRVVSRRLVNYSSDLFHAQELISDFLYRKDNLGAHDLKGLVQGLRSEFDNDPFSLSYSLKLLSMIIDRMLVSASCGERLFQRLGSDYHRIIIAECLIEGLMDNHSSTSVPLDVSRKLKDFKKYLSKIDQFNDDYQHTKKHRESL